MLALSQKLLNKSILLHKNLAVSIKLFKLARDIIKLEVGSTINIPGPITESIAAHILKLVSNGNVGQCADVGRPKKGRIDLCDKGQRLEVKTFTTDQKLICVNPTQEWDKLVIIDATDPSLRIYKVYLIDVSSNSSKWKKFCPGKDLTKTTADFRESNKSCMIKFDKLDEEFRNKISTVFKGDIFPTLEIDEHSPSMIKVKLIESILTMNDDQLKVVNDIYPRLKTLSTREFQTLFKQLQTPEQITEVAETILKILQLPDGKSDAFWNKYCQKLAEIRRHKFQQPSPPN